MVIIVLIGDFLAMSLTTDNVKPSAAANEWRIFRLTMADVVTGLSMLAYCTVVLVAGKFAFGLRIDDCGP